MGRAPGYCPVLVNCQLLLGLIPRSSDGETPSKSHANRSINFRTDGTYVQVLDVSLGTRDGKVDDEDTSFAGPVRTVLVVSPFKTGDVKLLV